MTKCEELCREVNDGFGRCLEHAFKQRFDSELDTIWNLFTFSLVSNRADGEALTEPQWQFIEDWSAGYQCAMNVGLATQHLLDRKRAPAALDRSAMGRE